jgi:hypothetical protein
MSLNLFVNKVDTVKVVVYCWEADGEIEATHTKSEVPKETTAEEVEFVFRKPGYADSNIIIRNSNFKTEGGEGTTLNITSFQENVLRSLLMEWTLKDEEGEKVSVNTVTVNNLIPAVARAAVGAVLERIRI